MLTVPFFQELEPARNVLIAGIGGGFDVFSGLPLYFGLREAGKRVHLANLSFSRLPPEPASRLSASLLRVQADTPRMDLYFPEKYLAQWFRTQGEDVPIYCFERTGVGPLLEGYRALIAETGVVVEDMPEVRRYRAATEAVFAQMPHHISIVSSSILSALAGMYGDHHATDRTEGSALWINPLMTVYWCFRLAPVAERILYREAMLGTQSYLDILSAIHEFRTRCRTIRPPVAIPL